MNSSELQEQAFAVLSGADRVLVGAGAGLSAAAGLDYAHPRFFGSFFRATRRGTVSGVPTREPSTPSRPKRSSGPTGPVISAESDTEPPRARPTGTCGASSPAKTPSS